MIRGTAQPFRFKIPCNFNQLTEVTITFWQDNYYGIDKTRSLPIIKVLSQCKPGSTQKELIVVLNKEETLRFTDKRKAYVQILADYVGGLPFGNKPEIITVYPVRDEAILNQPAPDLGTDDDGDGVVALDGSIIIER